MLNRQIKQQQEEANQLREQQSELQKKQQEQVHIIEQKLYEQQLAHQQQLAKQQQDSVQQQIAHQQQLAQQQQDNVQQQMADLAKQIEELRNQKNVAPEQPKDPTIQPQYIYNNNAVPTSEMDDTTKALFEQQAKMMEQQAVLLEELKKK
jgi:tRNA A37 threonylcarbamoyladenosine modification protein TsaB